MIDAQPFLHQQVVSTHHVLIVVVRESGAQAVARLTGTPMADRIRKDDEISVGVERLALAEKLAAEAGAQKWPAGSSRAVHHDDGVIHTPGRIARWFAQGGVVQAE